MLHTVWVDRDCCTIEEYIEDEKLKINIKPILFENFLDALEYIKSHKNLVDLIISNYSTLSWGSLYSQNMKSDLPNGFEFFDELNKLKFKIPFIMFTGMTYFTNFKDQVDRYLIESNFSLIEKYMDGDLKGKIEEIHLNSSREKQQL